MKLINVAFANKAGGVNYVEGMEVDDYTYMNDDNEGRLACFPPGTTDFSIVPVNRAIEVGRQAFIKTSPALFLDIEYLENQPTSECFHTQDPDQRPYSIEKRQEYINGVRVHYDGPIYWYGEVGVFEEYARVTYCDQQGWREQEMYDLDNDWNTDMRPMRPYVNGFLPSLYSKYMWADPALTWEEKTWRWNRVLQMCHASMNLQMPEGSHKYVITTHDSNGNPLDRRVLPFQLNLLSTYAGIEVHVWNGTQSPFTEYQKGVMTAYI